MKQETPRCSRSWNKIKLKTKTDAEANKRDSTKRKKPRTKKKHKRCEDLDNATKHNRKLNQERVQRFRNEMISEQLEEKRRKDRERYKRQNEQGLLNKQRVIKKKEQRVKREKWRKATATYRSKI